ncbi:Sodium-dependent nutrient amino acid transporter 1 [Orchesella cincta]|uniref:Sodium-dependent nutrient amino acid transporter 1 n=1 Tax=Orchesella cincta TaxID=48709 RepID=A0A1D2NAP0_ORCCI|nr:Sodium-dependent nutrient amino acid transporter 1 [Orchesella cincta]
MSVSDEEYDNPGFENDLESKTIASNIATGEVEKPKLGQEDNGTTSPDSDQKDGKVENVDEESGQSRDTWDNPIEFLLSCISMSVGLGNVWSLVPYILVLLFVGRPLYYLEMCLGQFSRYSQIKIWYMAPIFKGVGYGAVLATCCLVSYYVGLMAITTYYFIVSFSKVLPWDVCDSEVYKNETINYCNITDIDGKLSELYYYNKAFPQIDTLEDGLGSLHWKLSLCLIFSWVLIFLALFKGIKSSGKVAYFTAIFPYVVLFILLIRGVTLPGAWNGIKYFLEPQWDALKEPKVFYAAVEQCFFSLGTGFGPIIMFSSFNPFHKNVYKDALIISVLDTCTSLLAGITVFSVMGYLNHTYGFDIADIQGGPGLAFILYPQAIAQFGWAPQLFAVLFFLMLFTLGLGTAGSLTGGVITIICDQFSTWKRWLVTLVVCISGCLIGLMYVTEGGMLMLDLIDHYGAGFIVYVMVMLECAGISYVYGLSNFCNDIEFMVGRRVGIYWRICWGIILPGFLLANLLYYLISEPEFKSGPNPYPKIATTFGWLLTALAAGLIPAWGIHAVATRKAKTWKEKLIESTKPTQLWGPQEPKLRREWLEFRAQKDANEKRKKFLIF